MATNSSEQPLSSGRWDATGTWQDAVKEQRENTILWAEDLDDWTLSKALLTMAEDFNAFTLYERKALLEEAAFRL